MSSNTYSINVPVVEIVDLPSGEQELIVNPITSETLLVETNTSATSISNTPLPVQGFSAYDIAVQNGFVGTEEEWLDSIARGNYQEVDVTTLESNYIFNHNYGYFPEVIVLDLFNREIDCEIEHVSNNQFVINLSSAKQFKIIIK